MIGFREESRRVSRRLQEEEDLAARKKRKENEGVGSSTEANVHNITNRRYNSTRWGLGAGQGAGSDGSG